jgi:hypothetical protein
MSAPGGDAELDHGGDGRVSLYQLADREIRESIKTYLDLAKATSGLSKVTVADVESDRARLILLAGINAMPVDSSPTAEEAVEEWRRRQAVPFDLEAAITAGVYARIRSAGARFLDELEGATRGFTEFDPELIVKRPYLLPLLQHLAGIFSKAALRRQVGHISDVSVSLPAARRLSGLLQSRVSPTAVNKGEILKRLDSTLEGIVRDLVGRVLLESIVETALRENGISFQRESEYASLAGVIYDFRADFVLPRSEAPRAFIEVRKSSSRHASLYAKDKMFSAINWKGRNTELLAILVVDGEWTRETLRVLARVFDYVVPVGRVPELVETIKAYLEGDLSKLKWLVEFQVRPAQMTQKLGLK